MINAHSDLVIPPNDHTWPTTEYNIAYLSLSCYLCAFIIIFLIHTPFNFIHSLDHQSVVVISQVCVCGCMQ